MSPEPIFRTSKGLDLSDRVKQSSVVVASPAAAAETIICQTAPLSGDMTIVSGVIIFAWAAYTVGASGTAVQLRVRQTNLAGAVVGNSGALTGSGHAAGILSADDVQGFDAAPPVGAVYVLTMQVTAGAGVSTVSAAQLAALAV